MPTVRASITKLTASLRGGAGLDPKTWESTNPNPLRPRRTFQRYHPYCATMASG